jgi:hypothetical protein
MRQRVGDTIRHDPIACPVCGFDRLTATTKIQENKNKDGKGPVAGDYTICAECGEFLQFGEGLTLKKAEIPADAEPHERELIEKKQAFFRARGGSGK